MFLKTKKFKTHNSKKTSTRSGFTFNTSASQLEPPQASWNELERKPVGTKKIQAESNTLQTILRQHSIQVTIIVRCYPQETKTHHLLLI